ncbi:MAG: L-threonylcarbamoyladenylate synthase [Muribaculaceae bacterium]|nr:L-threonylcarbamoyladenylate synthase [Muribaculaceae bacterium]
MEEDIDKAVETLRNGGVILYPTDTIWGLGCDATNEEAVKRIYSIKQRADNKAMLVLVDSLDKIDRYVKEVPEIAYSLIELSEKPITIIYDNAYYLAKNLMGEDNSVGIRVTEEQFSKELCRKFKKPIVSTSANISGQPSAPLFEQISEDIKNSVDYIVKYRQDDKAIHQPSSIIKLSLSGEIKILRK